MEALGPKGLQAHNEIINLQNEQATAEAKYFGMVERTGGRELTDLQRRCSPEAS
jgi:hypothetical protein